MANFSTSTVTRRATLLGTAALASLAATGGAKASSISYGVQRAFDDWQSAKAEFWKVQTDVVDPALERFYAILPDRRPGLDRIKDELPTPADRALNEAANENSGLYAAENLADAAFERMCGEFERFIGTMPRSMPDVRLQAEHLREWLLDVCDVEGPLETWFETLAKGDVV